MLPYTFEPLPLGSIKPMGWLRDQLGLMANGLPGHEADFYRYVKDSVWTGGGKDYSGLHEAAAYWFNYIVPLAYGLDDARLKNQVRRFVDHVLDGQAEDGWIGPERTAATRDLWARFPVMLGLMVGVSCCSCIGLPTLLLIAFGHLYSNFVKLTMLTRRGRFLLCTDSSN